MAPAGTAGTLRVSVTSDINKKEPENMMEGLFPFVSVIKVNQHHDFNSTP